MGEDGIAEFKVGSKTVEKKITTPTIQTKSTNIVKKRIKEKTAQKINQNITIPADFRTRKFDPTKHSDNHYIQHLKSGLNHFNDIPVFESLKYGTFTELNKHCRKIFKKSLKEVLQEHVRQAPENKELNRLYNQTFPENPINIPTEKLQKVKDFTKKFGNTLKTHHLNISKDGMITPKNGYKLLGDKQSVSIFPKGNIYITKFDINPSGASTNALGDSLVSITQYYNDQHGYEDYKRLTLKVRKNTKATDLNFLESTPVRKKISENQSKDLVKAFKKQEQIINSAGFIVKNGWIEAKDTDAILLLNKNQVKNLGANKNTKFQNVIITSKENGKLTITTLKENSTPEAQQVEIKKGVSKIWQNKVSNEIKEFKKQNVEILNNGKFKKVESVAVIEHPANFAVVKYILEDGETVDIPNVKLPTLNLLDLVKGKVSTIYGQMSEGALKAVKAKQTQIQKAKLKVIENKKTQERKQAQLEKTQKELSQYAERFALYLANIFPGSSVEEIGTINKLTGQKIKVNFKGKSVIMRIVKEKNGIFIFNIIDKRDVNFRLSKIYKDKAFMNSLNSKQSYMIKEALWHFSKRRGFSPNDLPKTSKMIEKERLAKIKAEEAKSIAEEKAKTAKEKANEEALRNGDLSSLYNENNDW